MIVRLFAAIAVSAIVCSAISCHQSDDEPVKLSDQRISTACDEIQKSLHDLKLEPEQDLTASMVAAQLQQYEKILANAIDPASDTVMTARIQRVQLLQAAGEKATAAAELKLMIDNQSSSPQIGRAYFLLGKSYSDAYDVDDVSELIAKAEHAKIDPEWIGKLSGLAFRATIKPGTRFPDFSFIDLAGGQHTIAEYRGKLLLIDFWATWCPPCRAELPNVKALYDAHHAAGFEVVGVSLDQERAKLDKFLAEKELTWTQTCDGKGWDSEIPMHFGIGSIPATFLIDADGTVLGRDIYAKELTAAVEKAIAALPTR